MQQQTWCPGCVGYVQVMPVVYCGLFPTDAEQFEPLREALGRLQLNDAALQFEPEVSTHCDTITLYAVCVWVCVCVLGVSNAVYLFLGVSNAVCVLGSV